MNIKRYFKQVLNRIFSSDSVYFSDFTYPSIALNPQKLSNILREADAGNISRQMELFSEIEEKDSHLASILQTRKRAVVGLEWSIAPFDDSQQSQKIAQFIEEKINGIENFEDSLYDILDAIGKGFSVSEIIYEYSEGEIAVKSIEWIDQKRFTFYGKDSTILKIPRILTQNDMVYGEELAKDKFIYFPYKAKSGIIPRSSLFRPIVWMYMFKNYSLKDWMIFNDRYAMPMRIGKYSSSSSEDEIETLKRAIISLGVDAGAIISENTAIELIEAKARGDVSAYSQMCEYVDRQMSKAVLGQTLTTDVSKSGSYALGKVQHLVRKDLLLADARALENALTKQLIAPLVRFHFGNVSLPRFKFKIKDDEDLEKASKVLVNLVSAGFSKHIPVSYVHKTFGIPQAKEKEETLGDDTNITQSKLFSAKEELEGEQIHGLDEILNKNAEEIANEILQPIFSLAKESSSYEELKNRLSDVYEKLNTQQIEELLQKVIFLAELYGRLIENEK